MSEPRLVAHLSPWSDAVEFILREVFPDGSVSYSESVIMRHLAKEDFGEDVVPTFRLSRTAAQELMDNLWQCGLRPTEGTGSAGQLAATQKHLEDMRKIAFKFIEGDK